MRSIRSSCPTQLPTGSHTSWSAGSRTPGVRISEAVGLEVDRADDVLRDVLVGHGFAIEEDGLVETWLAADARPEISPLHEDYRLSSRLDTMHRPHHMISRSGSPRRRAASSSNVALPPRPRSRDPRQPRQRRRVRVVLVRPRDRHRPRRTDAHRRRSPATRSRPPHPHHRHRPARSRPAQTRIKICYEPDNPASSTSLPQRRLPTRQAHRRLLTPRRASMGRWKAWLR